MSNKILTSPLTFSQALDKLKSGRRVKRTGWEDETAYLHISSNRKIRKFNDTGPKIYKAWTPDLLAHDWEVL